MLAAIETLLTRYETGRLSRRQFVQSLTALAVAPLSAAAQQPALAARSINHVTLMVSDVERSVGFYGDLFGLPIRSEQQGGVNLAVGKDAFLGLYDHALLGVDPQIHHVCFGIDGFEVDRVMETLSLRGIQGRVRMREEAVPELYFEDPDGITVQVQDVSYCGGAGPLGNDCAANRET